VHAVDGFLPAGAALVRRVDDVPTAGELVALLTSTVRATSWFELRTPAWILTMEAMHPLTRLSETPLAYPGNVLAELLEVDGRQGQMLV